MHFGTAVDGVSGSRRHQFTYAWQKSEQTEISNMTRRVRGRLHADLKAGAQKERKGSVPERGGPCAWRLELKRFEGFEKIPDAITFPK